MPPSVLRACFICALASLILCASAARHTLATAEDPVVAAAAVAAAADAPVVPEGMCWFRESSISRCIHLPWSDRSDWRSPCAVQLQGNFQLLLSQLLRECHPSHVSVTCMTQATSEFGSGRMHAAAGSHIYPQGAGRDRLSPQAL